MVSSNLTPANERIQPCSIESEEAILSSIFLDGIQSLNTCLEHRITDKCFYSPANRLIFALLMELAESGKPLSLDVVAEELRRRGELNLVGGFAYLMQISQIVSGTTQLHYFIERVKKTFISRRLILTSSQVIDLAYDENAEVESFSSAVSEILSLRYSTDRTISVQEAASETLAQLERFKTKTATEEDLGYEYPWAKFTQVFGGHQRGAMTVLAARPGGGKSSLARQALDHLSRKYGNVMLFSREMLSRELPPLFVQSRTGISWKAIKEGRAHEKEIEEFQEALLQFQKEKHLHVFDRERTLAQVVARATSFAQLHDVKAICVDYLQRYDPESHKGESRDQAIGRMTTRFKDLAMDLKIPILLLCQVNRSAEKEFRPLQMSDLRESGNIEQDADNIIFLEVPKIDPLTNCPQNPEDEDTTQLYVSARQVKGRSAGRGMVGLYFNLPTTTFRSAVQAPKASPPQSSSSSNKSWASRHED